MRHAMFCALAVVAALVQVVLVDGLPWPGGGVPDIALVLVVVVGLMRGPVTGTLTGFCAGLALDLAPPGGYIVGGSALVFCLIGYGCGRIGGRPSGSGPRLLAAAVIAVGAGEVAEAGIGLVAGDPGVRLAAVRQGLPAAVLFDVLVCAVLFAAGLAVRHSRASGPWAREPSFSRPFQSSTGPSFSRPFQSSTGPSFSRPFQSSTGPFSGQLSARQHAGRAPGGRVIRPDGLAGTGALGGAEPGRSLRRGHGADGGRRSAPRPDLGESALRARPGLVSTPVRLRLRAAGGGLRRQPGRPTAANFRPSPARSVRYGPARLATGRSAVGSLRLGTQRRSELGGRVRRTSSALPKSVLGRRARMWREALPWTGARSGRRGGMAGSGGPR